jgi:hypothetical protein
VSIGAEKVRAIGVEVDNKVRRVSLKFHVSKGLPAFTSESMRVTIALSEGKPQESLPVEIEDPLGMTAQHDNSSTASLR